jgi:two-component system OmpR family sensor kinase
MSRLPIRVRLALTFALVMALVFAAVGAFLYVRLGSTLDERIDDNLESRIEDLTALARKTDDVSKIDPSVLEGEGIARITRVKDALAGAAAPDAKGVLSSADLEQALDGTEIVEKELEIDGSPEELRLRVSIVDDLLIVVGESLEDRDDALDGLLAQLLVVLPVALLVSSVLGYLVAGAAFRPVEAMRRRAAEISAENADQRLPLPRSHDEVYRLGETLNEMLERLDAGLARERRFVADASHELRTPLATLRTELELAMRRPRSAEELERALRSAGEEVERLVRLAEDLLVLARADDGRLLLRVERHDVRGLLDAVAGRHDSRAKAAGRVLEVSGPDDQVITGDRLRLEQALGNLVDNALRYGEGTVRLEPRTENGMLVLSVSDEGEGFPPEFLSHTFERFSRADAARTGGGGVGLGLAIVEAIARAHGGSATAANRPEGGAEITLSIPPELTAHRDLI